MEHVLFQALPPGLDKSLLLKNGKLPPDEMLDNYTNSFNQTKLDHLNQTTVQDNLTESESLEQDGVLVVNVSTNHILNLDEFYPNLQITNVSNKMDEITNKIQSNSREITGDSKNNIKFKDMPDNITVAPAPTNGVLPSSEQDEEKLINKTDLEDGKLSEPNLLRPTESLQNLMDETGGRRYRRRRRRHGNGRRYGFDFHSSFHYSFNPTKIFFNLFYSSKFQLLYFRNVTCLHLSGLTSFACQNVFKLEVIYLM